MNHELKLAEQSVLGSMLRDNAVIADVVQAVRREDFYADAHQRLFAAVVALWERGHPVDSVTLADELKRGHQIEDVGGYAYLGELWDAAPSAASVMYYAGIVREQSLFRGLGRAAAKIQEEVQRPTGTAEQALELAEREVFALAELGIHGASRPLAEGVNQALDRLDARKSRSATDGAVLTGFLDLDDLMCGLQPGELILLAARPSTGKTALALGIARNVALRGEAVFFASLEQPHADLAERLLCCEASVDGFRLRKGFTDAVEDTRLRNATATLRGLPLEVDDASRQSVLRIAAHVRRLKHRRDLRLVVVDYLQLLDPEDRKAPRHEQVAGVSRRLKGLARESNLPVLCLCQLNREVEHRRGERPRLADLRDTGELEQNADSVLLLHRPEESTNVIEVILAKQRNGPTGDVQLTFLKQFMRFENFAVESPWMAS